MKLKDLVANAKLDCKQLQSTWPPSGQGWGDACRIGVNFLEDHINWARRGGHSIELGGVRKGRGRKRR